MSIGRVRAATITAVAMLALGVSGTTPLAAAADPISAVEALIEHVRAEAFDRLDEVVCEAQVSAVRRQLDSVSQVVEATGLDPADLEGGMRLAVEDVSLEQTGASDERAVVRLAATLRISMDAAVASQVGDALVTAFGGDLEDADTAALADSVITTMTAPRRIDEDVIVIVEGGEWLVCDPLGSDAGLDDGAGGDISFDGLCGLVTIDEVNATGPLTYDSSFGFEDSCSYTSSDLDVYYSLAGTLDRTTGLDAYQGVYPDGRSVSVGDREGLIADGILYLDAPGGGTLIVTLFIDDPGALGIDIDEDAQKIAYAELLLPSIAESDVDGRNGIDLGASGEIDLCSALSIGELSEMTGLVFDAVDGSGEFCTYTTSGFEGGAHLVTMSLTRDASVIEFAEFLPGGDELVLDGAGAYRFDEQLFVDTELGVLAISAFGTDAQGRPSLDADAVARDLAILVGSRLPGLDATVGPGPDAGSDRDLLPSEDSLCALLDITALNGVASPLEYDDVFDGGADLCVYSATEPAQGFHTLSIFTEFFVLDELKELYSDGAASMIGGREAYAQGETLWLELDDGVIAISPLLDDAEVDPGTDALGFATKVAGLIVAAFEGS